MYWFQTDQNQNDVKFALMWWVSISFIWWIVGDPWLAIIPSLFMAFGDGITGVVRNAVVKKRSKSPIGNVFMLIVSAPLGWFAGQAGDPSIPMWGLIAAVVATVVEARVGRVAALRSSMGEARRAHGRGSVRGCWGGLG